jgi:hypothetical protein
MNIRSLRPRYAIARIRQIAFCRTFPDAPWLTASAIHLLESWLKPGDVGIEWGSGRSTLWFASRVAKLHSIEHNPEWYKRVSEFLRQKNLSNKVNFQLVPCPYIEIDDPPTADYANAVYAIPDNSVDFALVDGNIRSTCMRVAIQKIKSGGLLILDNANRFLPNISLGRPTTVHEARYECLNAGWVQIGETLKPWRAILTSDRIWDTRFWVKPCD